MSEIAKCPFCGENPKWVPITGWETGWKTDMLMCCGYGSTAAQGWNQYAAAMECQARHDALVEAVRGLLGSLDNGKFKTTITHSVAAEVAEKVYRINRAEVDRLIANESAADCEGEG